MEKRRMLFIVVMIFCMIGNTFSAKEQPNISKVKGEIVNNENLKLDYEVLKKEDNTEWTIKYQKKSESESKLLLEIESDSLINVYSEKFEKYDVNQGALSLIEKKWERRNEGHVTFTTKKEIKELIFNVKYLKKNENQKDNEVTDYGPYKINISSEKESKNEKEVETQETGTQETGTQETGTQETGTQETGTQETGTQETGTQETGTQETGTQETETQETGTQEIATQESEYGDVLTDDTANFKEKKYLDIFEYYNEKDSPEKEKGIYPKKNTNYFMLQDPNHEGAFEENKQITTKNFDFGSKHDREPETSNILGGELDFGKGYHHYNVSKMDKNLGIETKKTVKPREDDPTKFDIQLDIIGDATRKNKQVDVVFVIDKSYSMTYQMGQSTRWKILQKAMKKFANELLNNDTEYDIQMGLASFGSTWSSIIGNLNIFYEISSFGNGKYFTKNSQDLMNNKIISQTPPSGSGTPTFIGVDAGAKLLTDISKGARPAAEKHLIVLTDGMATFGPHIDKDRYITDLKDRGEYGLFSGTGSDKQKPQILENLANSNANYIKNKVYDTLGSDVKKYSIAFGVNNTNANIVLNAAGPDMKKDADNDQELNEVLNKIKGNIFEPTPAFEKGQIVDPMSKYVDLVDSVKSSALTLDENKELKSIEVTNNQAPQYAKDAVVKLEDKTINVSNLTLGASAKPESKELTQRHSYRLNYTVKLKEEYANNMFYPTNGPTYAMTQEEEQTFGFAVPSVRVRQEEASLFVKKIWDDQDNKWKKRKDVIIQLQQREKGSNGKWNDVPNQTFKLSKEMTEEDLTHEFKNVLFRTGNTEYEYRIEERVEEKTSGIEGYERPTYSHELIHQNQASETMTVTNKLKLLPIEIKKLGHDEKMPLSNVGFTIYAEEDQKPVGEEVKSDEEGSVKFDPLPIGNYVLKETSPIIGYEPMEDISFEIVQEETNRELSTKGLPEGNVFVNKLKDFQLKIEKKDQFGRPVPNVKFQLKGMDSDSDYDRIQSADESNDKDNVFTFNELKPGVYELKEVEVNSKYVLLEKPINITISDTGKVSVDEESLENVITNEGNIIYLEVTNTAKGILPSTGGNGPMMFRKIGAIVMCLGLLVMGYYLWRNRQEVSRHK